MNSDKSGFEIRNCVVCGEKFRVVIFHPDVVCCSRECEKKYFKI
jgi:hypothetical protein